MTRLQTFIALSVISFGLLTTANAQTVDEIINRYTNAIGGNAVLAGIQTMQIEGTGNAMGNDFPLKVTLVNGKAFKSETSMSGVTFVQCVTDTGGWIVNPLSGDGSPKALTADQAKALKSSISIGSPLVDYKTKGFSAALAGREDIQGVSAYKVHLFDNAGTDITYDLDPNTYLILQSTSAAKVNGADETQTATFSNYQKTSIGYTMAYTTTTTNLGYDVVITYTKVEFNQDIDPQTFAPPK
jgi:hypothetical protein